jgi:hypothetical protein
MMARVCEVSGSCKANLCITMLKMAETQARTFALSTHVEAFIETPVLLKEGPLCDHMILPSFPELYVRAVKFPEPCLAEKISAFEEVLQALSKANPLVRVPTHYYQGEQYDDEVKVFQVVDRIEGVNLVDVRADAGPHPCDEDIKTFVWDMIAYHRHILESKSPFILHLDMGQFTYGHTARAPTDRLYMQDLDINFGPFDTDDYTYQLEAVTELATSLSSVFELGIAQEAREVVSRLARTAIERA